MATKKGLKNTNENKKQQQSFIPRCADNMNPFDPDILLNDRHPLVSFHDSLINKIEIDYLNRIAVLKMSIVVGDPDSDGSEQQAGGKLTFWGLHHLIIKPPDPSLTLTECKSLWIDDYGIITDEQRNQLKYLFDQLPNNSKVTYFSIHNWYSNIYVCFDNAEFVWKQ